MMITAVAATATAASAAPDEDKDTYKIISYSITDPDLIKNPAGIAAELQRTGNLNRLGVKPAVGNKPSEIAGKRRTVAAEPPAYVIDSGRFPGGRKPDDPYQHADVAECLANVDTAGTDAGWIKNRYSYCQVHSIASVAMLCNLLTGCRVTGVMVAVFVLAGRGQIGAYPGTTGNRWADFTLHMQTVIPIGVFNSSKARISAEIECGGSYRDGGPNPNPEACHGGDHAEVNKSITSWVVDPSATLDLVSDAHDPEAVHGEQIATGAFHIDYDLDLPFPYLFDGDADGPEGGMRFDSAWYLTRAKAEQLGSVFDRAVPGLGYAATDTAVRGVSDHVLQAQVDPEHTLPLQPGKKLAGGQPSDPMHRLAPAKGQFQQEYRDENERVRTNYCNSVEFRATMPPEGGPYDCDEYPMGTTYEGAGRARYDGSQYERWYSVRWVPRDENQEAGRRLGRWYENDRILDADPFYLAITARPAIAGGHALR